MEKTRVKKIWARVAGKRLLAGNYWLIRLDLAEEFNFSPGQYVSLLVSKSGDRRSYSICSRPGGKEVELLIDVSPMGIGSRYILALKSGSEVEILGPMGSFVLEAAPEYVFVATGSGIAPFRSMVGGLAEAKKARIRLWWGMRYQKDLFWQEHFEKMLGDGFKMVLSGTNEKWTGEVGHVQDLITKSSGDFSQSIVYLCGGREMVYSCAKIFVGLGVPETAIKTEKYY